MGRRDGKVGLLFSSLLRATAARSVALLSFVRRFIRTLRGHVGAVYQVGWSADSRLVISASKDTTAKVWDIRTGRILEDLPGHHDEVYAVDWSPDGQRVASGGKDRKLKVWRH